MKTNLIKKLINMVKEFVNNIQNNKIMVNNLGIQKNLNRRNLKIIIISNDSTNKINSKKSIFSLRIIILSKLTILLIKGKFDWLTNF